MNLRLIGNRKYGFEAQPLRPDESGAAPSWLPHRVVSVLQELPDEPAAVVRDRFMFGAKVAAYAIWVLVVAQFDIANSGNEPVDVGIEVVRYTVGPFVTEMGGADANHTFAGEGTPAIRNDEGIFGNLKQDFGISSFQTCVHHCCPT